MDPRGLKSKIENLGRLVREKGTGRQLYYSKIQDNGFCIAFTPIKDNHDIELKQIFEQCLENSIKIANKKDFCKNPLYHLRVEGNKKSSPYVITAKFQLIPLATFVYSKNIILLQVMRERYFEPIILKEVYSALEKFCLSEA